MLPIYLLNRLTMDIRKVQRTGDMHYVYLPTSWCKKQSIGSNSRVTLEQDAEGNLVVSPGINEKKQKNLKLRLSEEDEKIIHKLVISCYINPLNSFVIHLEKGMDFTKLLNQKKLISLESVELDKNTITCESTVSISDPASLLKTMIRKIKNLLTIMEKNYNAELINRYEEEIDRNNLLIEKSTINSLTFNTPSKLKTIEIYYISMIARDLERLVDHIIGIDESEPKFIGEISEVIDKLKEILENTDNLSHKSAINFIKKTEELKDTPVKDLSTYGKKRIKDILSNISEVVMDWAITNDIDKEKG